MRLASAIAGLCLLAAPTLVAATAVVTPARAQQLDLSHGGPIDITARDGIEWRQNDRQVIARGDAHAVRNGVTVTADTLTAWYRHKAGTPAAPKAVQAAPTAGLAVDASTEGNEIYRLQAEGHVRISTATDQARGDKAVYDLDQSVLVMTGRDLRLTTPNNVITARDDLEYWPQKHMAVARGDAVVVTSDAKRIAADTLVAYTTDKPPPAAATKQVSAKTAGDPLASSGKLERVEAFGHVSVRTPTDMVTGDRGVYVPATGMARLAGHVRITRGQSQLNGAEADVNMKTGIATLASRRSGRVHGLVMPNDQTTTSLGAGPAKGTASHRARQTPDGRAP